jgi:putative SOS response-associated peptidase YedK
MKWRISPEWASSTKPFINARAETVVTKPALRSGDTGGLVVADSFYECLVNERGPQTQFRIHCSNGKLFMVSAVWENAGDLGTCPAASSCQGAADVLPPEPVAAARI